MNLKHFYYRGYFEGLDFRQPKKNASKEVEKNLDAHFKKQNESLLAATPPLPPQLALDNLLTLRLAVQNPGLLLGVGYAHEVGYAGEFKLGFHFDHTNGLPVLPGSSVKGALRSVFPQYRHTEEMPGDFQPGEKAALQQAKANFVVKLLQDAGAQLPPAATTPDGTKFFVHRLELAIFEGWDDSTLDTPVPKHRPMRYHATCFDAFPTSFAEVKNQPLLLGRDALTPHGDNPLKDPIPLPFLKVLPGVVFSFAFRLSAFTVQGVKMTAGLQSALFAAILETVGMGAKTNVGYGRLRDPQKSAEQPHASARESLDQPASAAKPTGSVPALSRTDKPLPFQKSLQGKGIIGEVVRVAAGEAWFRVLNVMGFDGEVSIKNPSADRFEVGKQYELRVSEANAEKGILKVQISSLKPLD